MAFTETKVIKQITILPQSGAINVQWANQVLRNGEVISETFERKGYESALAGFGTEVGQLDVNAFLAAFNTASLDEKAAATAALADKEAQIAALEMQIVALTPAPITDPREAAKAARAAAVAAIKVTTAAGNTFDGDELSQGRMARAIIALSTGLAPSVNWVLADNTVIQATKNELTEALVLAGQAQAAIWVLA